SRSANKSTVYEVFILFNDLSIENRAFIARSIHDLPNLILKFIDCREFFTKGHETRGITSSTYLRLWAPVVLPTYKKILYADVDIIFLEDLTKLYQWDIGDSCFAGVKSPPPRQRYSMQKGWGDSYINAGVLIINCEKITHDDIDTCSKLAAKNKFEFQDQDIINSVFKGRKYCDIPQRYNFSPSALKRLLVSGHTNKIDIAVIHYIGAKPWNQNVLLGEFWWKEFTNCSFFDFDWYIKYCENLKKGPPLKIATRLFLKALFRAR
ncbi:glycosyltransferase family 8 protein, partial [Gayadomonas joobiniege]|uniref:glycosyltransferase family 8 protein n=1 Tax=Gayadomonas joobiniege TaxID=1234606 RepID=UPI00037FE8FA